LFVYVCLGLLLFSLSWFVWFRSFWFFNLSWFSFAWFSFVQFDLVQFVWLLGDSRSAHNWFVCMFGGLSAQNLLVWWVKCSHFGCLVSQVSLLWLFGESSSHNLVASWVKYSQFGFFSPFWFFRLIALLPLLILLIDCIALLSLLILLIDCTSPSIDSSDWFHCTSPPFDFSDWLHFPLLILLFYWIALLLIDSFVWLLLSLLVLLYGCFSITVLLFGLTWFFCLDGSLFDWLMMMVLVALFKMITHFGCCFPLVLLTADFLG